MNSRSNTGIFAYLFPALIALVIVFLVARFLFNGLSTEGTTTSSGVSHVFISPYTEESHVNHQIWVRDPERVLQDKKVFINERILVESGTALVSFPTSATKLRLDKNTRLKYLGMMDQVDVFTLENREVWSVVDDANLRFKFAKFDITPDANTVFNLSRDKLFTRIYVLRGSVTIQDSEASGVINAGEYMKIPGLEPISQALKNISVIGEDFKTRDWYLENNGDQYLVTSSTTASLEESPVNTLTGGIIFEYPLDESTVNEEKIDFQGKILNSLITDIRIGANEAVITDEGEFLISEVKISHTENDLVYKTFNDEGDLMSKGIITVYKDGASTVENNNSLDVNSDLQVYPEEKAGYRVISPASEVYETTEGFVRIDGEVPVGEVDYITVNDFRLGKFPSGGKNWYYFANAEYDLLRNGINLYKIKYFNSEDEEVHSQLFIIKKTSASADNI